MVFHSHEHHNQMNQNSPDSPLFESDESDFDEFERHLSQYENRDDDQELFNDDTSMMEHDNRSQDDSHQISLATSFCRNTQEPNDNFLDDKFNGDQLLENFSEDKFITCKYSEDFYVEQHSALAKQQSSECEFDLHHHSEHDKNTVEERSSEDERVIENRKRHFLEFISTLPKVCTPSVCGTMIRSSKEQIESEQFDRLDRLAEADEDIVFEDNEDDFINNSEIESDKKFDWSIDQLATLKPVDISFNERRFLRFKDFEQDQLTQEKLSKENDMFFSQETIAPSPSKRVSFQNVEQEFFNKSCNSRLMTFDQITYKDEGKDSGNYSDENGDFEQVSYSDKSENKQFDQFEFSFNQHSNRRISNIECNSDFRHQSNTPLRKSFATYNNINNLDFKPKSHLQTSTPCASLFTFNKKNAKFNQQVNQDNFQQSNPHENFVLKMNAKTKVPLQEKNNLKQKKRLFHNLQTSNDLNSSSSFSFYCTPESGNNSTTNKDEGVSDQSRDEIFDSSSSMMSVCDNNSLTPRPKKTRSNVKPFAKRLDEIEFFGNQENSKPNSSDSIDNIVNANCPSNKYSNLHHNHTDSNCFVMCKNFNNLLNNSDSGCYLSSNGSDLNSKRRVLFD